MARIEIDGSEGEGGGQIVRTALALSLVTGRPFRIVNVRARRQRPGLMRQHLAAVEAAARIGDARVTGAEVGSQELSFEPSGVTPGSYTFSVGTAGSATLVLQTVLPALLTANGPSSLVLEGGTHNPLAPPFEFLEKAFLPLIARMGPGVGATLERPGFYPAGGGRFRVEIVPAPLSPLTLLERGEVVGRRARAVVSKIPLTVAERELGVVRGRLGWDSASLSAETVTNSPGPGNVLLAEVQCERVCEVFTGFGEKGVRAEEVARRVADDVRRYLASGVPVAEHLADQLVLPLAMAGRGAFRTLPLSRHAYTQIETVRRFLEVPLRARQDGDESWVVEAGA